MDLTTIRWENEGAEGCMPIATNNVIFVVLGSCGSFEGCAWSDGIVFARERIGVYDPHMIHDDSACLEMMIFFTGLGLGLGLPEILMKYFAST